VQKGAQDPAHMSVVVDDEKTQAVEIDADHGAPGRGLTEPDTVRQATGASLRKCLG
jgi:hypothetical protein